MPLTQDIGIRVIDIAALGANVGDGLGSGAGMEAIRNEVWDLYNLLRENSRYPACILSIEPAGTEASVSGEVQYVPDDRLAEWMRQNEAIHR